jgi:hypothetical protein
MPVIIGTTMIDNTAIMMITARSSTKVKPLFITTPYSIINTIKKEIKP